jgi:mycothiol system anti-sigma-R factor
MDCTQTRDYLHGYIDRELDPVSAAALEQHLQSCAACQHVYERQSSLRAAVGRQAAYYTAPGDLADRIRARIGVATDKTVAKPHRPDWQWLQLGAAVAVTAVVTWMVTLQMGGARQDEIIAEQVITGHARSVLTNHLTDVASSDQHTVKPWLSSRLDFSPPVTDLTTDGYPLVGGRLDYLDNRPVAALVYRHRQHVIDLFIWPDPKANQSSAMKTLSRQGYNVLHWSGAGMTYWAISDLNQDELDAFTRVFSQR